jgi:hypothetical protein
MLENTCVNASFKLQKKEYFVVVKRGRFISKNGSENHHYTGESVIACAAS